jgi:membrane protein YqaA with SNARE-associated domain
MTGYLILFASAFGAATILPFYSEVVLVAQLTSGLPVVPLWAVATAGNTLGAVVNWALARYARDWMHRRGLWRESRNTERAAAWFRRYGAWSLLMTWLPVGGDALTVIAGLARVRLLKFLVLVAIGKGARYAAVIATAQATGLA